ncbi:hypothetical protein TD95_000402 [Thielaviopsis punctulata]|uniref:Anaphase-promoting complex subunit 4 WD40 domain-containing protein n=1 Tax=Thielaviopsis punctulata TaxID=72032 RepID=A0A0F4ZBD4_9PEZI|nr:hypothetical protein TD95_000402 [Thielaviopsis punctulata]
MVKRKRSDAPVAAAKKAAPQPLKSALKSSTPKSALKSSTPKSALKSASHASNKPAAPKNAPGASAPKSKPKTKQAPAPVPAPAPPTDGPFSIQIVTGSYDRVLHGMTVRIAGSTTSFADTFLFNAHTSAIRCLAVSPPSVPIAGQTQKVFLASGSTDERINIYNLSAHEPKTAPTEASADDKLLAALAPRPIRENKKNREVGALMHHSSSVTALAFPTRGKLLSAAEDSTIAVTRARDWQLLSTIKVPIPKAHGRPTGDTAVFGGQPAGVNSFAVHPSLKVMISVSKGEKSMRLWNLVTGKKAGVLNFGRDLLVQAGEGKHSSGEGRQVVWGSTAEGGDEFAVAFERDVVVFGMDSTPRCVVLGDVRTKVHRVAYVRVDDAEAGDAVLAVSTEDGRVLFYSTRAADLHAATDDDDGEDLPTAKLLAQVGGRAAGVATRIKDFKVLRGYDGAFYVVGGSSDGRVRVWRMAAEMLAAAEHGKSAKKVKTQDKAEKAVAQGELLGTYETQNRITCLEAFVLIPRPEGLEDSDEEESESESDEESDDE